MLIGRAEAVVREIDTRTALGSGPLSARVTEFPRRSKSTRHYAEQTLSQLLSTTNESLGKSVAATSAVTEALNRSALETAASLNHSAEQLTNSVGKSTAEATASLNRTSDMLTASVGKSAAEAAAALGHSAELLTTSLARARRKPPRRSIAAPTC